MSKFIIHGNKKLKGEIQISGAKNAVFPVVAACLLTSDKCTLTNIPEIDDKKVLVQILQDLGADVVVEPNKLVITAANVTKNVPDAELVGKLRGSILILGALLGRLGKVETVYPGGDRIGRRPIDPHLAVFRALGANVEVVDSSVKLSATKLVGTKVVMEESSVLGTENAILAAVTASGTTTIKLAAMEPHVQQLCVFLNKMGGKISGIGTPTIIIEGVSSLHGADIDLIPDSEEAASFITMAAATKSEVKISGINPDNLDDYLMKLKKMNVQFEVGENYVKTLVPTSNYIGTKIQCGLYPKLNSDYLPPMSVLATQAEGESIMHEWMYESRQGYAPELKKMGANAEILDTDRVRIIGPSALHGAKSPTYDLRMGMTLVVAALVAEGQSEITDIHHIDRGYANLEQRLQALGADIQRVE